MIVAFKYLNTAIRTLIITTGVICVVLLLSVGAPADTGGSLPPWSHEVSDLPADPAVVFGRLPNGFRFVLMENNEPKDRVSMHLNVQAGSLLELDDQQGIAHFLEHMQFNGSAHFKPGELVEYFQTIGMQFGPDANAHTGFDETVYDVVLPKGDETSIKGGLLVLKDYAEGALLVPDEIERERGVILAEKRSRDSVDYRTLVSSLKFEFPEARLSNRLPIGEDSVLKVIDRVVMKSFYDTWYRPENMVLVIVGDFDYRHVKSLIHENFSQITARAPAVPKPDLGPIRHEGEKAFYHFEPEAGATTVRIEVLSKVPKKHDSMALRKQMIAREVADRIVQNRLSKLVRKSATPFTSANIHSGRYLKEIAYAEISAECSPEKWSTSLAFIEQVLRTALVHGFTPSELARVKKDYLANLDNAVKQAPTRKSSHLSRQIIHSINSERVFLSPALEKRLFGPFVQTLDTATVHEALRQTWAQGHRLVLVTGNAQIENVADPATSRIMAVFRSSGQTAVTRPVESEKVVFPYLAAPAGSGRIVHREEVRDLGIIQVDFANGIRLNLKKTDFEAEKIRFKLIFGRGRSDEPLESPGLSMLAEQVVKESGLGELSRDELDQALAGKELTVRFQVSEDFFSFNGMSPSQDIELVFELLRTHMVDPGFRAEAYELAMERFAQMYRSLNRDVDGAMKLVGQRFMASGDTRFGLPAYDEFKTFTLADVRSWVEARLREDVFEISLAGDFDENQVISLASTYFGTLDGRKSLGPARRQDVPQFPRSKSLLVPVETQIPKSLVVVAYPTDDFWDIQRTRRLSVLGDIFSEKLRERIREKLGASYSPYAYNRSSRAYPGYGMIQAFVNTDPLIADDVATEVKNIAQEIARDGVTEKMLTRSLEPILTNLKDMRRSNPYWLRVLAGSRLYPIQLDWCRSMLTDYTAITAEEIFEMAQKYLRPDYAAQIIVRPMQNTP